MSRREITEDDIESLAVGAWILGTGGGGNPYLHWNFADPHVYWWNDGGTKIVFADLDPKWGTGVVRLKLYKGNLITAGRKSPVSLYNPHSATMEADPTQAYNQTDATGFIALNALRLKASARQVK